uniref:EF-hand domain-containing protein n=1 Tax=Neobodo designis TaxID=312471 RepID=A0A7S1QZX2_NEODS|mmetsp:Transcript_5868/g.18496  ORF Transcript_5868/g.18496 Transcript_5868/m.18496 type:complete len:341 (+) Transcript_5868:65-1087(+)|eukprot:CAMPEP_0174854336 /NCGR_PEP_ID=MMETSP1114-20130205/30860_1 /TAXON_ID=312471 /ORGANISM="Neobodo designis, Strain CCAP 1951/1" /LENGTH=340 /DNA_ID=CAMNT_0016089021 /DNA_START=65 /DNA_END=1087 /DNA_ORIENTATION=+
MLRRAARSASIRRLVASRNCSERSSIEEKKGPKHEVAKLVASMERDPELIRAVVAGISPESRRRLVVTGGAFEWFGEESVASEMARADAGQDRVICPKDFDNWFEEALRRKAASHQRGDRGDSAQPADTSVPLGNSSHAVPLSALLLVALEAGLPFVGFGFLDNAMMILAGDAIDRTIGLYLNCSVMASAAMGNIVSGCLGMQVHGFVEKIVQRLNLPIPPLSDEQRRSQRVFMAGHVGGTIGVATGLSLGLLPLLFIADEDEKSDLRAFQQIDKDGNGLLSESEFAAALREAGVPSASESLSAVMARYASTHGDRWTPQEFHQYCQDVRDAHRRSKAAS